METNQRPYHLVVFGASGFTGQFVAEEVAREQVASGQSSSLPWAVAGRSREKLQRVLERAALKLGRPTLSSEVGIIICDVTNPASLDEMAKQAAIVLNCVGPYRFYGEPVVKACVENGTSCIDICGEPQVSCREAVLIFVAPACREWHELKRWGARRVSESRFGYFFVTNALFVGRRLYDLEGEYVRSPLHPKMLDIAAC
uniref:Saccharopine dehydrogenase-like oxidoreductase n=1 Tax=Felis catus TaxID=9685 RepID=A0ABI7WSG8_FELCA